MRCLDIGRVLSFDELVTLRAKGNFEAVVPYLDPYNPKGADITYLRDIYRAGLRVPGFFYETTGGAGQGEAYFTRAQGVFDATNAEQLLGLFIDAGLAPGGVIVWYAADVNIEPAAFDEYANGIESVAGPLQTPGIYGFQRLCEHAAAAYPHLGRHLAQTYGTPRVALEVWQYEQITIDGITVDVDEVSVPGWAPGGEDMTGDQVKDLIREMLRSPEGAQLVDEAIANGYGPRLRDELNDREARTVIEAQLGVKDECLKPRP